jgi:imidazolonepropionase-like amidohydrolase
VRDVVACDLERRTVTVAASRVLDVASALQAIRSATLVNAELLRMQGRIGTLEPGAFADVIAVEGDPLADVRTLEHPVWIVKGGKVASDGDRR